MRRPVRHYANGPMAAKPDQGLVQTAFLRLAALAPEVLGRQAGQLEKSPVEIRQVIVAAAEGGLGDAFRAVGQPRTDPRHAQLIEITLEGAADPLLEPPAENGGGHVGLGRRRALGNRQGDMPIEPIQDGAQPRVGIGHLSAYGQGT